jgi:hypothetical protein
MDFDPISILSLGEEQVRLLAVWHVVPVNPELTDFDGAYPDLYEWGLLAGVPVDRVAVLWPTLRALGAVRPDRTVPAAVRGLLVRRAKELVEDAGQRKGKK